MKINKNIAQDGINTDFQRHISNRKPEGKLRHNDQYNRLKPQKHRSIKFSYY